MYPKYVVSALNCADIFLNVLNNRIAAHRRPMTIYFKSRGRQVTPVYRQNNMENHKCFLMLEYVPQTCCQWGKLYRIFV